MSLLFDAAVAWENLRDTEYYLLLGRKGKAAVLPCLKFLPEHFPHLAGLQYAKDIDFGVNRAELRSGKFISKIIKQEIDAKAIEKAEQWSSIISGRLEGIIELESTLDSDFLIYSFNSKRVPHGTTIEAKYVIKNPSSGITFFVFVDEDNGGWFCRSVFKESIADYTNNQAQFTVLKKQKRRGHEVILDYIHPNYKP